MPMNTTCETRCGGRVLRAHDLLDDLAAVEVALEAGLAGRAERAAHRAPGLRRDAHGRAVGAAHEHGLDLRAVVRAATATCVVAPSALVCIGDRRRARAGARRRAARAASLGSVGELVERRALRPQAVVRAARRGTRGSPHDVEQRRRARRASRRSGSSCASRSCRRRRGRTRGRCGARRSRASGRARARRALSAATNSMPVAAPRVVHSVAGPAIASARPSPVPCVRGSTPIT